MIPMKPDEFTIDDFENCVDTDIETNVLPRLKRGARNVLHARLGLIGLSEDQIKRFAAPPLRELFKSAKAIIERGSFDVDKSLIEFDQALLQRVQIERERGELRPVTAESEIKNHQRIIRDRLYRAFELDALHLLIKPGERIVKVDWWTIETDRQVIRRADLPKISRPISFRNGNEWRKNFVSDREVEEAISSEEKRKQPIRGQSASPWIE